MIKNLVIGQTVIIAAKSSWFSKLSPKQKKTYKELHPNSKLDILNMNESFRYGSGEVLHQGKSKKAKKWYESLTPEQQKSYDKEHGTELKDMLPSIKRIFGE